jgi:4-hydroxy-3-polyprenylbenzoate decarboxylase
MRPRFVRSGAVLAHTTTLSQLPQLKCWPLDGGPFVTLPAVGARGAGKPGGHQVDSGMVL